MLCRSAVGGGGGGGGSVELVLVVVFIIDVAQPQIYQRGALVYLRVLRLCW